MPRLLETTGSWGEPGTDPPSAPGGTNPVANNLEFKILVSRAVRQLIPIFQITQCHALSGEPQETNTEGGTAKSKPLGDGLSDYQVRHPGEGTWF